MAEPNRTGRTVAIVGGAALVAWLLSRGKGWGLRGPGDAQAAGAARQSRCVVWIRPEGLTVDGVAADLPTVIARCRAAGEAEVHATGDTIHRVVRDTVQALHAAGVRLYLAPNLSHVDFAKALP
ncbi:MAG: hypothetical protein AB7T06_45385 [Kofleriaceae bacterium]